jgi:hypothetical protein
MKTRLSRLAAVTAIGAALLLAKVSTDYDHKVDFGRYHTYSWGKAQASNSIWQDRIMFAVDSQLAAKGWTRVASGGDAIVASFGVTKQEPTIETYYNTFPGWYWRGWDGMASTYVDINRVGNLTVDVFDSASHKLIWRGTAEEALSSKPEKNEKKLDHSVEEMFEHFPPQQKS